MLRGGGSPSSQQQQQQTPAHQDLGSTLHVSNIPEWVEDEEFSRHFSQLDGWLSSRLIRDKAKPGGTIFGFVDFDGRDFAVAAKHIYDGWQGWNSKGITIQYAKHRLRLVQNQQDKQRPLAVDPRLSRRP